ncbi:MAG: glutaredoxin family protein [Actinomycetota bacterium]
MTEPVTMYTTSWCGYCRRLERQLEGAGIAVQKIDIEAQEQFGARIERETGGYRTVPTLEIEGELYVNPSFNQVVRVVAGPPAGN